MLLSCVYIKHVTERYMAIEPFNERRNIRTNEGRTREIYLRAYASYVENVCTYARDMYSHRTGLVCRINGK